MSWPQNKSYIPTTTNRKQLHRKNNPVRDSEIWGLRKDNPKVDFDTIPDRVLHAKQIRLPNKMD